MVPRSIFLLQSSGGTIASTALVVWSSGSASYENCWAGRPGLGGSKLSAGGGEFINDRECAERSREAGSMSSVRTLEWLWLRAAFARVPVKIVTVRN